MVKLAVAVVLAGGVHVTQNKSTGVSIRSEPHLLLVGDPGTGKSQLLRFASKVIPRSVLTTGVGSTAAGLTVTAFMENGAWQLEGGALVLSDGGLCCIDEFNSMKEHDRTCIHEAMEQQTISVAKASIVCKLNTRCSILAATNPKGNLDPQQPLNMNVALASPLLSRFDLIFLLRDSIDDKKDSLLTDYILNGKYSYSNFTDVILWNLEMLQVYFATIRKMNPMLSSEAHKILTSYYQRQRQSEQRNKSRTTVRLLDSLVRLSQGHAKLMSHPKVEIMDALYAILLVEGGLEGEAAVLGLQIDVNSMFPNNAMEAYRNLSEHILTKLQLLNLQEHEKQEFSCEAINDQDISTSIGSRFFYDKQPHEGNNRSNLDELSNKKIPVCEKSDSMNSKACHLLRRKTNNPEILHRQANVNSQGKKVKLAISDNVKKRKKTVGTTSKKLCLSEKSSESGLRLLTNITSVKDDFVIDVNLNYNSDENITEQVTNDGTAVSCESPNVKKEDKKDVYFTKDKMGQIQNEDSDIQFLSNPIDCRLSQGSKLKLFRKMFEFEPRKQNLLSRSKNSNEGASRIGIRRRHYVKSSISSSSTHFQSQPNEIDNLDLDL